MEAVSKAPLDAGDNMPSMAKKMVMAIMQNTCEFFFIKFKRGGNAKRGLVIKILNLNDISNPDRTILSGTASV